MIREVKIVFVLVLVAFMLSAGFATVLHVNNDSVVTDANNDMDSGMRSVPSGWHYKKNITIDPPTPVDNYQVKIVLNNNNFDYSHANANGSDLRFHLANGTELPYWIEEWEPSGTSTVWVNVTTTGTDTIYMFYGNPNATAKSNPDATFDLYDDFNETSLNTSKWIVDKEGSSNAVVELDGNGHLHLAGEDSVESSGNVKSVRTFTNGYIMTMKHEIDKERYADASLGDGDIVPYYSSYWRHTTFYNGYLWYLYTPVSAISGACGIYRMDDGVDTQLTNLDQQSITTLNEWHTLDYVYTTNGYLYFYHDDTKYNSYHDTTYQNNAKHLLISQGEDTNGNGGNRYIDYVIVRKYSDSPPQATLGTEVTTAPPELPGWHYRSAITISPCIENYQIKVVLNTSNFDYSHAQSDGSDLRFYREDGVELPYFIENWNTSGNSTVWVRATTVGTNEIYMFYGNPIAPPESNPDATFDLYDKFNKTITAKYLTDWTKSSNNPLLTLNSQNWMASIYNNYDSKIYIFANRAPAPSYNISAWRFSPADAANPANWEDLGIVFSTTQSWDSYHVETHGLIFETQAMADAREGVAPGQGTRMWRMYLCGIPEAATADYSIGFAYAPESDLTHWTEYSGNPIYPHNDEWGFADNKVTIYQNKVWMLIFQYKSSYSGYSPFYAYSDNGIDNWTSLSPWAFGLTNEDPRRGTLIAFDTGIQMIGGPIGDKTGDYYMYFTSNGLDKARYSGNPILTTGTWDAHLRWTTIPIDKDGVPLKYNNNYFMFYVGSNSDNSVYSLGLANGTTQVQETAHVLTRTKWTPVKEYYQDSIIWIDDNNTMHLHATIGGSGSSLNTKSVSTFSAGIAIKVIRKYTDSNFVHVSIGNGNYQPGSDVSGEWYDTVQADGYDWWQNSTGHYIKKTPANAAAITLSGPVTFGALNTYETDEFIYDNNGVLKWLYNGIEEMSATDTDYMSGTKYLTLTQGSNDTVGGDSGYDLVIVRKYADPEPTTTVGAEVYVYTPSNDTGDNNTTGDHNTLTVYDNTTDDTTPDNTTGAISDDESPSSWLDTICIMPAWIILVIVGVVVYLWSRRGRR